MQPLELTRHKQFRKDINRVKMSDKHFAKFILYISTLLNHELLPKEALDHSLSGEYSDCREFHVSGDLLVIYLIDDKSLILIRIGSHSQLFK